MVNDPPALVGLSCAFQAEGGAGVSCPNLGCYKRQGVAFIDINARLAV